MDTKQLFNDKKAKEDAQIILQGKKEVSVNEMLKYVGEFKLFQRILDVIFCIVAMTQTQYVVIMLFAALTPAWSCKTNSTSCSSPSNMTISPENTSRCYMLRSDWKYATPKDFSIVTQFDIDCGDEWQLHLTTSSLFIGWTIGAFVLGWVADSYGRKFTLIPSSIIVLFGNFITAFSPSIWGIIVLRFIVGFFTPGVNVQIFIIISEYVSNKYRPFAETMINLAFAVSLCILGIKAYFIRQWNILFIVCSVPYILVLALYKFVPESVRWLRLRGKHEEAIKVFNRIAKWNKTVIPDDVTLSVPPEKNILHKSNYLDLFRSKKLAVSTLIQGYTWLVNGMVYYGVSFAAADLGGSLYRNFILLAAIEFPAHIVAIYVCSRFGRKKSVIVPMFVVGSACVIIAFIPTNGDIKIFRVLLGMLGKLCITITYDVIFTWSVELFPTSIRASGMGFTMATSTIGGAISPWVAKGLRVVHVSVPFIFMGVAAFVAAAVSMILPETKGTAMGEVVEEEEENLQFIANSEDL